MQDGRFPSAPCWTDLRTFPFSEFREVPNLALFGGFPCQPFSVSGLREADDDPRHLFPAIEKGIAMCKPRLVLLENVDGIASAKLGGADETSVLKYVLESLEGMGYVAEATSVSAREVGGGHNRRRWFIMGVLADSDHCGGLRVCRDVARLSSAPSKVQSKGDEPTEEIGCGSPRPEECGYDSWDFPSRPHQQQFGWESPRILAYSKSQQDGGLDQQGLRRLPDGKSDRQEGSISSQTEPSLGQPTDGTARRLGDSSALVGTEYSGKKLDFLMKYRQRALRLLGNSVCPQSASRAVRILATRIANRVPHQAHSGCSTIEGMIRQSTDNPL